MTVTATTLLKIVSAELAALNDARITEHVRSLLVPPVPVVRAWDYGTPDEAYPCWSVLEHKRSNTGIAYCESGFGPSDPWGLVFLNGTEYMSIGMDAAWYPRFLDAYFESMAASELHIWRVLREDEEDPPARFVTPEGNWDETWAEVERLRAQHPQRRYHCTQSIYRREA